MEQGLHVSVVIPAYRSATILPELVQRLEDTFRVEGINYEIIIVNDCSPDDGATWDCIQRLTTEHTGIVGIDLQKNSGQFNATMCGMEQAKGDLIITMDDDLQHAPEAVPLLLDTIQSGNADCVMASFPSKRHSLVRNFGSLLVRSTYRIFHGLPRGIRMSSFRCMTSDVAAHAIRHRTRSPVLGAILIKSSRRIVNVEVDHHPRASGSSGYGIGRLVKATLDNIFLATTFPLRIFTYLGIIISTISVLGSGYYATQFVLKGTGAPGFTTLVLLQLFLIGITSIGLGLMGEYIDRIIDEVDHRPRWHVRHKVESDELED